MILVRNILQAQYGKAGEAVALFKQAQAQGARLPGTRQRLLTDLTGPFDTIVTETVVESLDEYYRQSRELFADPKFGAVLAPIAALLAGGRREIYTIEAED
jgi:hypothetical protein